MRILPLLIAGALLLSGCGGSPWSNYHPVEDLQPVLTIGYDLRDGLPELTAASVHGQDSNAASLLTARGNTVAGAAEALDSWAAREALFFPHVRFALLGEAAAEQGLGEFFQWVMGGGRGRLELPLYIIRYSTARALITDAGTEEYSVTAALEALEGREERAFTLLEIARQLAATEVALCSTVEVAALTDHVPAAGAEARLPRWAGYAVLREGEPIVYLTPEESLGAALLTRRRESYTMELADGLVTINPVALQIRTRGDKPEILLDYTARPMAGGGDSLDPGAVDAALAGVISAALARAKELNADFMQLGVPTDREWNLRLRGTVLPGAGREAQ